MAMSIRESIDAAGDMIGSPATLFLLITNESDV
jgi:hypothetical protein